MHASILRNKFFIATQDQVRSLIECIVSVCKQSLQDAGLAIRFLPDVKFFGELTKF